MLTTGTAILGILTVSYLLIKISVLETNAKDFNYLLDLKNRELLELNNQISILDLKKRELLEINNQISILDLQNRELLEKDNQIGILQAENKRQLEKAKWLESPEFKQAADNILKEALKKK
jgi:preprotein translocase subunit SecF